MSEKRLCRTCEHWKWHSRNDDPDPRFSMNFHYCDVIDIELNRVERRKICQEQGYYKAKADKITVDKYKSQFDEVLLDIMKNDVGLAKAADILWQWKIWENAKAEERYGVARGADRDAQAHLHKVAETHRLQLEHYMVVANIEQDVINMIVRPKTEKT